MTIDRIGRDRLEHVEVLPLSPPVIALSTYRILTDMVGTARP